MSSSQLLDYIRQNIGLGVPRQDIEKALLVAGWPQPDIANAFAAIEHPQMAQLYQSPQQPAPDDVSTEAARIQKELESEAMRQKWKNLYGGATVNTPVVGGIIGWLIRKKIVEQESQANIALLGVAIIAAVLAVIIFMWGNGSFNSKPPLTPQEIDAIQHPPGLPGWVPPTGISPSQ